MTVREIFDVIVEDGLYEFRTKDPYNVVRNQLKRHCVENTHSCAASNKVFRETDNGRFSLL